MGKGTPCPMPPRNRAAIREALSCFWAAGFRDFAVLAVSMQQLWPGCNANHVRGVIAGLHSAQTPRAAEYKRRSAHAAALKR